MSQNTEGKWIVHFPYLHKKSGVVVQVDKKSTDLDQSKSSSRVISILDFFFFLFIMDLVFTNENR